jgi:hypothetical protein
VGDGSAGSGDRAVVGVTIDESIANSQLESLKDSLLRCEVASCLRLTQDQARTRIHMAKALSNWLPGTLDALARGRLDWHRTR